MKPKKEPVEARRGWSFARLLLVVAVVGTVAGAVLGEVLDRTDEVDPERFAEAEVRRVMPLGAPLNTKDPMEPDPASLRGIPPYPGVYPRRLIRQLDPSITPMTVSWFSVEQPASVVLDFYEQAFRAQNRQIVTHRQSENMGYVAWLEELPDAGPGGGVLHMISALKQFSSTVVLVSASRPDLMMNARPQLPEGLELPPSASTPQLVQMGEEAVANDVVYSRALKTAPGEVVAFFERQFKDKGFAVTESTHVADQWSVTAQKGGTVVVVGARSEGEDSSLMLTYERRRAPQEELQ